jgi:very-short-patch-repair endonuclease
MTFRPYNENLHPYANDLRSSLTEHERILWSHIRKKQMLGIQFYRQKIIGNYIVDFYAPAVELVIEVDGSQHYEPNAIEYDLSRDTYLNELGLKVLRFDNNQINQAISGVLEEIYQYIESYLR